MAAGGFLASCRRCRPLGGVPDLTCRDIKRKSMFTVGMSQNVLAATAVCPADLACHRGTPKLLLLDDRPMKAAIEYL